MAWRIRIVISCQASGSKGVAGPLTPASLCVCGVSENSDFLDFGWFES